ncbi:class I SAM-dependent methyltransferase [Paenibacillus eucommiae]|uniref:SAM-dependent methyltransferase n=1 Tax=Paenibacillus eucommiae TaxID=1355755 RepID=A0ABS4IU96_9BACL|nr:class I SAM-dependent methyltransferase [Paenibacillus eucommiae]MBP1991149.1 SAM-dependent methyltransferase [Paenibacillus eucommiae]
MEQQNIPLNLDYYSGTDLYSDGEVEDVLLNIVQNKQSINEVLNLPQSEWALLYHLSPIRRNLLEWYPFDKSASLLEIGAGCGALTGLFCEKVKHVTAVELSLKRSQIISNRCCSHDNLEIMVGNLNDMVIDKTFDYISLIGVLEYAKHFSESSSPYENFLKNIKKFLKPGGKLIIAIENKFGIKYWSGAAEDHSGKIFESIENYPAASKAETFGKTELIDLLKKTEFGELRFYYPMPDYKMPSAIYSDDYLPHRGQLQSMSPNYDRERYSLFNEKLALDTLIKNKQFDFFANSFLVICEG